MMVTMTVMVAVMVTVMGTGCGPQPRSAACFPAAPRGDGEGATTILTAAPALLIFLRTASGVGSQPGFSRGVPLYASVPFAGRVPGFPGCAGAACSPLFDKASMRLQ